MKRTMFLSRGDRVNMFEIDLKNNIGAVRKLIQEATDELDAWRKTEQFIKEKME